MRKPVINPGIINRLKMLFAIVQDGDTATRNIENGKCVIWKNTPCRAITDISTGDTLSSANLSTDAEGYINSVDNNISNLQDGLAIVANGDTHAAVSSGQFVYVKNHDTLAEGLYKASAAISANEVLSTSNLTSDGSGGLNALQADLNDKYTSLNSKIANLTFRYMEEVSFVFSNSKYATKAVSDIDATIANAKFIFGFVSDQGTPVSMARNIAKTQIVATAVSDVALSTTIHINVLWAY